MMAHNARGSSSPSEPFLVPVLVAACRTSSCARAGGVDLGRLTRKAQRPSIPLGDRPFMVLPRPLQSKGTQPSIRCSAFSVLPLEVCCVIFDFASADLLDLLGVALLDRQLHALARQRFLAELRCCEAVRQGRELLTLQVAQQFVALPSLCLTGRFLLEAPVALQRDAFRGLADDQALLHCRDCNTPIIKAADVVSSGYRVLTGRAYLSTAACNVDIAEQTQEAQYTTGVYTVRAVSCGCCAAALGITYSAASDRQNHYKVGKFLLAQNQLVRPACCLLRRTGSLAGHLQGTGVSSKELPIRNCGRCQRFAVQGTLQLVSDITDGLKLSLTRQLYQQLQRQRFLETLGENKGSLASTNLISWCLPHLRGKVGELSTSRLPSFSYKELWQDIIKSRLIALWSAQRAFQAVEVVSTLCTILRFLTFVSVSATVAAPSGFAVPEKVAMLVQLLPTLMCLQQPDAVASARAIAQAIRHEWVISADSPLLPSELETLAKSITATAIDASRRPPPLRRASGTATLCAPEEHTEVVECLACGNAILKAANVRSTDYRILSGFAYLAEDAQNLTHAEETSEVVYTSGVYSVRNVACSKCNARLGITYVSAPDEANQFKVGKFLLSQDHLFAPPEGPRPRTEAALRRQVLEIIRHGGTVTEQQYLEVVTVPEPQQERTEAEPLVAVQEPPRVLAAAHNPQGISWRRTTAIPMPRQQLIVTFKRYIRCMMPAVQYVPLARPLARPLPTAMPGTWLPVGSSRASTQL